LGFLGGGGGVKVEPALFFDGTIPFFGGKESENFGVYASSSFGRKSHVAQQGGLSKEGVLEKKEGQRCRGLFLLKGGTVFAGRRKFARDESVPGGGFFILFEETRIENGRGTMTGILFQKKKSRADAF